MEFLNKCYYWLNRFFQYAGEDGLKHIVLSAILAVILNLFMPSLLVVLLVGGLGLIKEVVWDKALEKGEAEYKDLICDAIGILIGII